jgi:hypothetical protein
MVVPWGAIASVAAPMIGSLFGGGESTDLEDLRTPEQKKAAALLLQLGETGSAAGINLGEAYGGSLGSYDTSGATTGYQQLMDLYGGRDINQARDVYSSLANTKFNPDDPSSGYAAFSRSLAKAGQESSDVLNREAAITGNRFGTAIAGEKANLSADLANQRGMYLAQLYNQSKNQALAGAQGLQGLATQQSNIAQNAAQMKILENQIKDQQAKDALTEYKRQRAETLSRIDLLSTEANRNPYMGVSSIPNESPLSGMINSVLGGVGTSAGESMGGWLSGLFSKSSTAGTGSTSGISMTPYKSIIGSQSGSLSDLLGGKN